MDKNYKPYIKNVTEEYDDSAEGYKMRDEMKAYRKKTFRSWTISIFVSVNLFLLLPYGSALIIDFKKILMNEPLHANLKEVLPYVGLPIIVTAIMSLLVGFVKYDGALKSQYSPYKQYNIRKPDEYLRYKNTFRFTETSVFYDGRYIFGRMFYKDIEIFVTDDYYYIIQDNGYIMQDTENIIQDNKKYRMDISGFECEPEHFLEFMESKGVRVITE
ncbi:MAG: hypothetical protein J5582_10985 [Ruminococcus sp.]|uniref:hypothetical protein n=1 Tax=Ruminococcus sp. TaxID=41978 RepID=UPI0025CE2CAE|nr:hypothetical protein [Ruminococcus sp.]MBO4867062.1 hypothetical protein [Ruminococcus sp.]